MHFIYKWRKKWAVFRTAERIKCARAGVFAAAARQGKARQG
eukprot:COSAG06_NODE_36369_length_447_cov_2430.416667_1_plen_40_part_10